MICIIISVPLNVAYSTNGNENTDLINSLYKFPKLVFCQRMCVILIVIVYVVQVIQLQEMKNISFVQ